MSGATVRFKAIRRNGTVTIQAFYDGALKYGADDVSCVVPVL